MGTVDNSYEMKIKLFNCSPFNMHQKYVCDNMKDKIKKK